MDSKIPDVSSFPKHLQAHQIACYKLPFIVAAKTNNYKPDYTDGSWKYEPRFKIITDKKHKSGVGLSLDDCDHWLTYSRVGPRLTFPNWSILEETFNDFKEVYEAYIIIPD
jgi:hypothetical protein